MGGIDSNLSLEAGIPVNKPPKLAKLTVETDGYEAVQVGFDDKIKDEAL